MKWFDNWFSKKCKQAWENDREQDICLSTKPSRLMSSADELPDGGLNIQVKAAMGGKIVVFRNYDSKSDRHKYTTYIIPDEQDFEKELGKMITLESMRISQ
jgi:hypothetical protein